MGPVKRDPRRMFEKLTHRYDFLQRCAAFGKREELAGKVSRVLRGLARFREKSEQASGIRGRFDLGEADVSGDDGENIVQIVRDSAGESAERFELTGGE